MPPVLRPTTLDDLPELSRFLTEGFHTPADAPFAAVEVLRWKFFDPRGPDAGDAPRSYVACAAETQAIVGHLGLCPGRFRGPGLTGEGVSTQHIIDWLTSETGRGVGSSLMRRAHTATETQYSFALSAQARAVGVKAGYELVAMVPVMQRVLRPGFRLRDPAHPLAGRLLRVARDLARALVRPPRRPRTAVALAPVSAFGDEIEPIVTSSEAHAVCFTHEPGLLNHLLRYPRGGLSGWHLSGPSGELVGFALLSLVPRPGGVREGRIVDCLLATDDPAVWHAAVEALTGELNRQGADLVIAVASTERTARALRSAGFAPAYTRDFRIRDRHRLLDRQATFHLSFLEADTAYTGGI